MHGPDAAAAAALDVGARGAWRQGAREEAAELAERALALTPAGDARTPRRLLAAAFQFEAANPTRARTLLRRVLQDDPTRIERLEALCLLGGVRFYTDGYERSIELLSAALTELGEHEHVLRSRFEAELAFARIAHGEPRRAVEHGEAAVAAARAAGNTALAREGAAPLVWASLLAGYGVRTDMVEFCLSGAGPTEPVAIDAHMQSAAVLKWGDQLDRARSVLVDRYERAQAQGAVARLPLLAWQIGDVEVLSGRWEAAAALAEVALEGARFRDALAVALCAALRARVHALRGRLDAARADVDEAIAAARGLGGIAAMAATEAAVLLETCRDDPAAVHAVAGPLVADAHAIPCTDPALLRWVPDEVEALSALGHSGAASKVLDWFEDRCRATGRRSGWAAAHRCHALLAASEGALDEAARHIATSVDLYAGIGMPFERARSLLVAGGVHRRRRQRAAAAATLHRARASFYELGAPQWAERADMEAGRLGYRGAADGGSSKLTAVETHVARLVAAGLRNRDIAAELFMSPRTVESHLTCIYRKLGVHSRTELAAALTRREPSNGQDATSGPPEGVRLMDKRQPTQPSGDPSDAGHVTALDVPPMG